MSALTPVQALHVIDAASTTKLRLGDVLESFASAADDRFLRRAPEYGVDHVSATISDLTKSVHGMQELIYALPAEGHATRQATDGLTQLAHMRELFEAGGVPFNFVDDVTEMQRSLSNTIRSTAADGLRSAAAAERAVHG